MKDARGVTSMPGGARFDQSGRLRAVQSPIIPVVAQWIRSHPGTISLGQGVVSYGPPPEVNAAIEEFWRAPSTHKYQAVEGIPALREALAVKLRAENGMAVDGRQVVLVTAGGNMAFLHSVLAIADPGDELILQTPFYFNHEMAIEIAGCRAVAVPTDANYQLDIEAMRKAITPRTRAIVTVSPNNPTGAVYPEAALREVNALCRESGLFHIHDEAYEYFTYDGARHFSPGSIPESEAHTISLFSLSKAYGFASWRIGYMAAPAQLTEALQKIHDTAIICAPAITQYAALGALRAGREYCDRRRVGIEEARGIVRAALESLDDICDVPRAEGAFYFLVRLKREADPMGLGLDLVRKHRVAVIPGPTFGIKTGCHLRVAYGAHEKDSASEGIQRLVKGLRDLAG